LIFVEEAQTRKIDTQDNRKQEIYSCKKKNQDIINRKSVLNDAPGNQASRRVAEAAIVKLVDRKIVTSNVNYFEKLHKDTVLPGKKSHRKQEMTGRPPGKETLSARNSPSRCSTPGKEKV
jgi:hypothetical protein